MDIFIDAPKVHCNEIDKILDVESSKKVQEIAFIHRPAKSRNDPSGQ